MPTVQAGDDVIEFPDSMSSDQIKSALDKRYASKALDAGIPASIDAPNRLMRSLSMGAEGADMGRRQDQKEKLGEQMAAERAGASVDRFGESVLGGLEKGLEFAKEMKPTNLLKRTIKLPEQLLGGQQYEVQPALSPETVRKGIDVFDPLADEPGSIRSGLKDFAAEQLSSFTSPDMAASLAIGKAYPELVGRQFQTDVASNIPEAVSQLRESVRTGDKSEIAKAGANLVATIGIPALIEKGARNAQGIRSGERQSDSPGLRSGEGQADSGQPVEQAPPKQPQPLEPGEEAPKAQVAPTVTETTPPVPADEIPKTPSQTGIRPAIRLVGGEVVPGDAGTTHPDIIKENDLKATDVDQRGFIGPNGEFLDREQAAQQTGLPTESEPQRQHSTDLPEASKKTQGTPTPPGGAAVPTAGEKPPVAEEQLPLVGMGGAISSEFTPPGGSATSIKNSVVDSERVKRGLPPAIQPLRRSFGEVWDRAMAMIDHDPEVTDNLLDQLRKKPRALTDAEDALILHRQVDLQNEYDKATRDLAQAHDDGRTEAVASERLRVANLSDRLLDLYNIGKSSGTETGRGLNARKMLANEDFTLAKMDLDMRGAKGGAPLTESESEKIKELHDKINATQKAYDDYVASTSARISKLEADRVLAEALNKAPSIDKRILSAAESIVKRMEEAAKPASDRLRERLSRLSAGVDPLIVADAAIVGSAKIARLGLDLAKFTDEMVRDFGEKIRPMIGDIWTEANKRIDAATSKATEPVKRAVKKTDLPSIKQAAAESISEKVSKGQKDKITWHVQNLARELVKSGVRDREELINQVHEVLSRAIPDITRRETMDAISGYGDYKQLSKDQISVTLRGMKGEMQQLAKLEDMAAGQPPLKSGVERRTPTEAERKLVMAVNDAKNKFQIPVSDPSVQLKSALDTLKTTLRNRITDYQDRIARGDFSARPRRTVTLDPDASRLKAENERVKKQFQRGVALERLKNRTGVERSADWVTKWRRGFILSGPVTLAKLTSAAVQRVIFSPVEELAGGVIGKSIPGVASRAAREGGLNVKAEAKALTQALTQGMRDAYKTLRTGQSDLDVLYGKEALVSPTAIDFFGHVHGALKAPVKRAEFARSFEKRAQSAIASGVDPTDPMIQSGLVIASYKDANRAIFQQDNRVVTAYKRGLSALEEKDKSTGKTPLAGKAAATAARVLLPIVKIPSNIVAETMQYALGSVTGSARLARAYSKGIESLKPEEADLIMRSLKKGSLGAAVLTLGFLNPGMVGGYYQPGQKRNPKDVKAGDIRINGHEIPSYLLHNPLTETLQIGATVRRVAESKLRKKDAATQGIGAGLMAAARGQAEAVPFVRETTVLSKALDPHQSDTFWQDLAKSLLIPQAVQSVATYRDKTPSGEPIKRQTKSVVDALKSGIPGLRETLPKKKST